VTLITHVRNQRHLEGRTIHNLRVRYVETERLSRSVNWLNDRLWRKTAVLNKSFLESLSLLAFDRGAVRIAKEEIACGHGNIIHRVSPISIRARSGLGGLGVPFILGPLNGGMEMAPGFGSLGKRESQWVMGLRALSKLLDPRSRTLRSAHAVLVARRDLVESVPAEVRPRTLVLSENAVDPARVSAAAGRPGCGLSILYLGRLIPCKGARLLLAAMDRLRHRRDIKLLIVGDGPDRADLLAYMAEKSLAPQVRLEASVPPESVAPLLHACDVLALPSVRESGGGVILEAMAAGRPVIAFRHGGPATLVPNGAGLLLPPRGEVASVEDLAQALEHLADHPKERLQMGRVAGHAAATEHTWERRVDVALELYREALSFGSPSIATSAMQVRDVRAPKGGVSCSV
jgi:glycosyltransferase involved in cell wall biosynthesis